ncbi:thiamine phosphate synthase [Lederbergia galactosidilytica]|uniref:thiamine phosphate synthase n=1 Tax=Lederbergia galactosidilytica TaxID=217031 RepID=UPI000716F7CA|nr:thiamine phosphate synthase [Lederbergia galactosidilytica]MBP1916960.1 thiazole tautomerase (transcriptional regulator TenI) [Lederbergia galactosidilytica]
MKLLVVTNDQLDIETLAKHISEMDPYVDFFIIREKSKTIREQIHLLDQVIKAGVSKEKLIINDRVDLALVLGISKVQLPAHGLDVQEVENHFPSLQIGKSIHSLQEALTVMSVQADWLLYGHIFPTNCKAGLPARGLHTLRSIVEAISIDVYAIGGIKPEHVQVLSDIGVKGLAVMSTIFDAPHPAGKAKEYYQACQRSVIFNKE